jgi:alkanesulfonate monooxygenase SsuD/methylene tetrahydromethanopterin reductase-like flavin-dependent oxidoreductase (luciferase family)
VADTDEEADYLRSSQKLAFARLRSGNPGKLPKPSRDIDAQIPAEMKAQIEHAMSCSAVGSPETVEAQLRQLIDRHKPDEIIGTGMIHDHQARLHSFKNAATILKGLCE